LASARRAPDVEVSLAGLNLSEEDERGLAREIAELIATEVPRSQGVSRKQPVQKHLRVDRRRDVTLSLREVGLDDAASETVASAIEAELKKRRVTLIAEAAAGCVCAISSPGRQERLDDIDPPPWVTNPGNYPYVIAAYFREDVFRIQIDDGSEAGVGASEIKVGLNSRVAWAKEIWALNYCRGRTASVFCSSATSIPSWMRLDKGMCFSGAHTIVFRKPKAFGLWADVFHFPPDQFWRLLAGKAVTFTWFRD
jgi:hypothetical protein